MVSSYPADGLLISPHIFVIAPSAVGAQVFSSIYTPPFRGLSPEQVAVKSEPNLCVNKFGSGLAEISHTSAAQYILAHFYTASAGINPL